MQTVAHAAAPSKPAVAYHCTYLGLAGVLTRPADRVLFMEHESGAVVTIHLETDAADICVLGRVDIAMEAYVADLVQSRAAIVCGRTEGRQ